MITRIEDYFALGCGRCARHATPDCATQAWTPGLTHLRRICLSAGLSETVKWGHPCYTHAGRNVALLGALRDSFRLGFFNAGLLRNDHGLLVRQGPNTAHPDTFRFTDPAEVTAQEPQIRATLAEAMGYAEAGMTAAKPPAPDLPLDLIAALDADPALAEAFHALTPGRRKSYVLALASAKTQATRDARIARFRPAILAGRGALDR